MSDAGCGLPRSSRCPSRDRRLVPAARRRTPAAAGGRLGDRHAADGARHRRLAALARLLDSHAPRSAGVAGGEAIVRIDTLSAALLPFAAGLWLLTVAVTPRAALDRRGLRRTALATLITLASFLTESAVRAPRLVGGLGLDVPVRARRSGASTSAARRRGVSRLLDAAVRRRRRPARRSRRAEHRDRNGRHVADRDRRAGAEGDCAVSCVGAGSVRPRTARTGHPVQRSAGGRLHDRGADRAARLAGDAAGHRPARARRPPCTARRSRWSRPARAGRAATCS